MESVKAHAETNPVEHKQVAAKSVTNKVIEPVAEPVSKVDTTREADDSLNWSELAFELKLDGLARQLAMNCVVNSYLDNRLHLVFLPELELMLKPDIESQIKQALEDKLGVSLKLEFSSQATLDCETPQQADIRKQEQHRQQVIQSIRQDPVVQQLKTVFGAELIEDSVQKLH